MIRLGIRKMDKKEARRYLRWVIFWMGLLIFLMVKCT